MAQVLDHINTNEAVTNKLATDKVTTKAEASQTQESQQKPHVKQSHSKQPHVKQPCVKQRPKKEDCDWVLLSSSGMEFELNDKLSIGREESADLKVSDSRVSRKHAALRRTLAGVLLEDLGSANGTLVNGSAITQTVMLKEGDVIDVHAESFTLNKLPPLTDLDLCIRSEQLGDFDLNKAITIGRDAQCDITIAEDFVSRRHAAIRLTRRGAIIEDFGSSNGTYLNETRINTPSLLKEGDQIRICDKLFHVCKNFDPDATRIAMQPFDPDATQIMVKPKQQTRKSSLENEVEIKKNQTCKAASASVNKTGAKENANKSLSAIQKQRLNKDKVLEQRSLNLAENDHIELSQANAKRSKTYCLRKIDITGDQYLFKSKPKFLLTGFTRRAPLTLSRNEIIEKLDQGMLKITKKNKSKRPLN